MKPDLPKLCRARILARLERLYGVQASPCLRRLTMMNGRYGLKDGHVAGRDRWNEHDAVLITYGDMIRKEEGTPLAALKEFFDAGLADAFSILHILPFFPYSSDDGFSVIHYRTVNPELGGWPEIQALGARNRLMFDLVLNHVSARSGWARDFMSGIAPARDYLMTANPKENLSAVVRPRTSPLLTPVMTRNGPKHVWTTFSADQLDLNFANPDVLFEMLDILMFYASCGAKIIRLDAIAYLWKKAGTTCIHLPETHEVVKLFRDFLEVVAPDVLLLTETNVPQDENYSYFGDGDESHLIYQFPLPPLLLHGLRAGTAKHLTAWAAALPACPAGCTVLNFTASHDGIGVRPLQGLLPEGDIRGLVDAVQKLGGQVSTKRNSDGSETPYELNITYFDALKKVEGNDPDHVARFLCSQIVPMVLKGIPAVYFNSLLAAPNDYEGFKATGRARSLNRKKWLLHELDNLLNAAESPSAKVFREYTRLLRLRGCHPAFHPDGGQNILNLGDDVFAVERVALDGKERIISISNFADRPVIVPADRLVMRGAQTHELIRNQSIDWSRGDLSMSPYQTLWLTAKV